MIIEQAKGIAQRGNLSMHTALHRLRRYVRNHNALLNEVARQIVETDPATNVLDAPASSEAKQLSLRVTRFCHPSGGGVVTRDGSVSWVR